MTPVATAPALARLDHLRKLMAPAGIVQFSRGDVPDLRSGTCLDDNARAWLAAAYALNVDGNARHAREIGDRAAAFVTAAQRGDGLFHNLANIDGMHEDDVGSEDSIGRAIWAAGIIARCSVVPEWRSLAIGLLDRAHPAMEELEVTHARAYATLGLCAALAPESAWPWPSESPPLSGRVRRALGGALVRIAGSLLATYKANATADWPWWSDTLTWGNARLPESMIRAAIATGDRRLAQAGMTSLEFLASVTQSGDTFVPIGNDGWYKRGSKRALHDQQPIEACGMVDVWLAAYRLTGVAEHLDRARVAYDWFHGANTEGIAVAQRDTGGCRDGLLSGALNPNQGAESTLSYVHATLAVAQADALSSARAV